DAEVEPPPEAEALDDALDDAALPAEADAEAEALLPGHDVDALALAAAALDELLEGRDDELQGWHAAGDPQPLAPHFEAGDLLPYPALLPHWALGPPLG